MTIDPFADLDAYVGLPRVDGLRLSPDGRRLVVSVATPDPEKNRYSTALWEVDPEGARPARRLTRSSKGESVAAFTPAGDLLFTSARLDPTGKPEEEAPPALWLQPAGGGDARVIASPPGGVGGVIVSGSGTVLFGSELLPSSADLAAEEENRKRRKDAGVSAILHEEYPIRLWDHDLGPDRTRLLVGEPAGDDARLELRDLTGHVGRALGELADWDLCADGRTVVTGWAVAEPGGDQRYTLVAIDVATGERRTLADDPDFEYLSPRVSPDGTQVVVEVYRRPVPRRAAEFWLGLVPLAGGPVRDLTREWDRWPGVPEWTPDGSALIVSADDNGRSPLWRVDATTGEVTRLTLDDGAYTGIQVAPDGSWAYAMRAAVDSPPAPVRVRLTGEPVIERLNGPAATVELPGRLEEVTTTAADGTALRGWIAVPHAAGEGTPAPLLLWIHGGPYGSWNSWSWRWNPWIAVAHGYAVLLPDPAMSTGYGWEFVNRSGGNWGEIPYNDLMAVTDAALERPDVDATRTAAMGGSYGGYMANWIAGHTDRFAAIVTHASVWTLDHFSGTTDGAFEWAREVTPEMALANSPHRFAGEITTPMLVIHGDKDYRVPIGEALHLWWELLSRSKAEDGSAPHKFLYFPDENHWVLKPQHAKVWYQTVLAFLAQHLDGKPWERPELLG